MINEYFSKCTIGKSNQICEAVNKEVGVRLGTEMTIHFLYDQHRKINRIIVK